MTSITIPEYITHVELSKTRRPKYYTKGSKIPNKYSSYKKYDIKGRLLDNAGDPVIANPALVNKPRMLKINGQQLYSGNMNAMVRSKVVSVIKDFMKGHIPSGLKLPYPIYVRADLYTPMAAKNWDLDNQWIYHKCFLDALVAEECLPDDNIMFVTEAPAFRYFPVDTLEERKIVYHIGKETREEILKHPAYVAHHGWGTSNDGPTSKPLKF